MSWLSYGKSKWRNLPSFKEFIDDTITERVDGQFWDQKEVLTSNKFNDNN